MNVAQLIKSLQETPNMDADAFPGGADVVSAAGDFTGGASEDLFTAASHGFADNQEVVLLYKAAAGVLTGVSVGDHVFIDLASASTFGLAATSGGTRIENTADGDAVFAPAIATVTGPSAASLPADAPDAAAVDPGVAAIG